PAAPASVLARAPAAPPPPGGALRLAAGGPRGPVTSKMSTAAATAAPATVRAPAPATDAPSETAQPAAPVAAGAADPPPAPEVAPAVAPAQVAAHVEVAAKEAGGLSAPAPAGGPADLGTVHPVNIPRGGSILAAARELYGDRAGDLDRSALLEQVRRLNPGLRDVNLVKAGAMVKFPSTPGRSENDGPHPE